MANIITKKQVGLLQTAKTKLGLSEEDYRSLLYKYGVDSTKELTQPAFKHLLKTFQRLGFEMQGRSTAAQLRENAGRYGHIRRRSRQPVPKDCGEIQSRNAWRMLESHRSAESYKTPKGVDC